MDSLKKEKNSTSIVDDKILQLRTEIDREHQIIFQSLVRRFSLAEKIWEIKKQNSTGFVDEKREQNLLSLFDKDLELQKPELKQAMKNIFRTIIDENKKYLTAHLLPAEKGPRE